MDGQSNVPSLSHSSSGAVRANPKLSPNQIYSDMPRSKTRRPKSEEEVHIQCHCSCPNWGKPSDTYWVEADDCHHKMLVCGLCLTEGRITDCRICLFQSRLN